MGTVLAGRALVPPGRSVLFLGDGEFDGTDLLADVRAAGWRFICRTAKNVRLAEHDWILSPAVPR